MRPDQVKAAGKAIGELGTFALWLAVVLIFSVPTLIYLATHL